MDRNDEKQHSVLFDRNIRFSHEPNIVDNLFIQTHSQSTKLLRRIKSKLKTNDPEDDDNVCIVWLTNNTNNDIEFIDTRPIKIFYSKIDFVIFICELHKNLCIFNSLNNLFDFC